MSYYDEDRLQFADPGGRSSLRKATMRNPRNLPCPTCGEPNKLTPADRDRGYQCNGCATADEMPGYGGDGEGYSYGDGDY